MFPLFKCAISEFQLFKIAYSLSEELGWGRSPAGRKRLGGLLWVLARAPAGDEAIDRAADELLAFTEAAMPDSLSDSRAGESAWWLRRIALETPYSEWSGLVRAAPELKRNLAAYWDAWSDIRELLGPAATQLSSIAGLSGLIDLVRELSAARAEAARQRKVDKLEKVEAERSALPRGQLEVLGETADWRVEVPHDEVAAAHAGHRTSWCTARKPEVHFSEYHKPDEGQFIYVFTNKRDGSRYQATFHPGGGVEVRDEWDGTVDNRVATELYRVLRGIGRLPSGAEGLGEATHALDMGPLGVRVGRPSVNAEGLPHGEGAPAYKSFNSASGRETAAWYRDGALHREGGPAIEVRRDGAETQIWYRDGVPGREDGGPAMVTKGKGGGMSAAHLEADGKVGRDPALGPAEVIYDAAGKVLSQKYMRGGRLAPAPDPRVPSLDSASEKAWVNQQGERHRADGPAIMRRSPADPGTDHEEWYRNGRRHREGAPAVVGYGGMINQHWVNGVRVRPDGKPYADVMEAAVDDMRRIKPGRGNTGLEDWSDAWGALADLRGDVLRGDVRSDKEFEDRIEEIAYMASGFTSVPAQRATERIIGDFSEAAHRLISGQ